ERLGPQVISAHKDLNKAAEREEKKLMRRGLLPVESLAGKDHIYETNLEKIEESQKPPREVERATKLLLKWFSDEIKNPHEHRSGVPEGALLTTEIRSKAIRTDIKWHCFLEASYNLCIRKRRIG